MPTMKEGYKLQSKFLAGMLEDSPTPTTPTWKGKYENSSFLRMSQDLYEQDYSQVCNLKKMYQEQLMVKGSSNQTLP